MNNNLFFFLLFLFSFFFLNSTTAQFSVQGTIRPRAEYRNGYQQMPDSITSPAFFISNRLRLALEFKNEKLSFKASLQEVRTWGSLNLKSESATLGLNEAWAEIKITDSLFLKLGRQGLNYDNQRLLAVNDWRQSGQYHDALLIKYKHKGWNFHLLGAYNQSEERLFNTYYDNSSDPLKGNYKTLSYIWIDKKWGKVNVSALAIADGLPVSKTSNRIYQRITTGGAFRYTPEEYQLSIRAYSQNGKNNNGTSLSAWYFNAEASIPFSSKLKVIPGIDILSGDDNMVDNRLTAFSTLYGAGHAHNGHMDYFTNVLAQTDSAGLSNIYLKFDYSINTAVSLIADFHYFALQSNHVATDGKIEKYLSSEADLACKINFTREMNLQFGYSFMLHNSSMKHFFKGDPSLYADFGWVMLTINPVLFQSVKN